MVRCVAAIHTQCVLRQLLEAKRRSPMAARSACVSVTIAVFVALIAALACSARVQGLLVFLWFVDWPPAAWDAPMLPFPCWSKAACRWDEDELAWMPPRGTRVPDPLSIFTFPGTRVGNATSARIPTKRQGVKLGAWVMCGSSSGESCSSSGVTLIYAHGNAGNRATGHRVKLYEQLLRNTAYHVDTVVAFDYSGFADSGGGGEAAWDVSEERVVADMLAVDAWVKRLLQPKAVIWWGHSLGTGVVLGALEQLAALGGANAAALPSALVLEAPFTSVVDVAAIQWGMLAQTLTHTFHSLPRAQLRLAPVLVLHGVHDTVIPVSQGKAIADAAGAAIELFDSGHDDIIVRPCQLARAVGAFFDRHLGVVEEKLEAVTVPPC